MLHMTPLKALKIHTDVFNLADQTSSQLEVGWSYTA